VSHDCEKHAPKGYLTSGYRQDGEEWECPDCGLVWIHVCDEAEGCYWYQKEANRVKADG
jgi:hypothetical protein